MLQFFRHLLHLNQELLNHFQWDTIVYSKMYISEDLTWWASTWTHLCNQHPPPDIEQRLLPPKYSFFLSSHLSCFQENTNFYHEKLLFPVTCKIWNHAVYTLLSLINTELWKLILCVSAVLVFSIAVTSLHPINGHFGWFQGFAIRISFASIFVAYFWKTCNTDVSNSQFSILQKSILYLIYHNFMVNFINCWIWLYKTLFCADKIYVFIIPSY